LFEWKSYMWNWFGYSGITQFALLEVYFEKKTYYFELRKRWNCLDRQIG